MPQPDPRELCREMRDWNASLSKVLSCDAEIHAQGRPLGSLRIILPAYLQQTSLEASSSARLVVLARLPFITAG